MERSAERTTTDPDLQKIVDAWPSLPPAIRSALAALVEPHR